MKHARKNDTALKQLLKEAEQANDHIDPGAQQHGDK